VSHLRISNHDSTSASWIPSWDSLCLMAVDLLSSACLRSVVINVESPLNAFEPSLVHLGWRLISVRPAPV